MILMLTCGAVFGMMTISQASPIAEDMIGMSVGAATAAVPHLFTPEAAAAVSGGFLVWNLCRRIGICLSIFKSWNVSLCCRIGQAAVLIW